MDRFSFWPKTDGSIGIVLCDLDGCIADLWSGVYASRGITHPGNPIPVPRGYPMSGLRPEEDAYLDSLFLLPSFYRTLLPMRGAKPGLWGLVELGYVVHYITARGTDARLTSTARAGMEFMVRHWLERWEMPEGPVEFCHMNKKGAYAQHVGASFAIEDNPVAIESYLEIGLPVYALQYPYNAHLTLLQSTNGEGGLTWVTSVAEIPYLVAVQDWFVEEEKETDDVRGKGDNYPFPEYDGDEQTDTLF